MRCPRCGGYLTQEVHYEQGLDAGTRRDWYARCWECGDWHWKRPRQIIVTRGDLAVQAYPHSSQWCVVLGCSTPLADGYRHNSLGMCGRHYQRLYNWQQQARYSPAPVIRQPDGTWIDNPDRQVRPGHGRQRRGICIECGRNRYLKSRKSGRCTICYNRHKGLTPAGKPPSLPRLCADCGCQPAIPRGLYCQQCREIRREQRCRENGWGEDCAVDLLN